MRTLLAIFLTLLLLPPISAIGEIQSITHIVRQTFGGSQSADDARISAVAKAKREALEEAGTYLEALTVVKEAKVDKDEILALTAGVVKAEVMSQKNYHTEDAFGIEIVVKVTVDTSVLEERVKKLLQDRTHLEQLNQARKKEKELLAQVARLEEENKRFMAEKQPSAEVKKGFQEASRGLTAVDWFYKALALWDEVKITDKKRMIEYLNEAIQLRPDYAQAYIIRGIAYSDLGQYQRAIEDFNEAIRLKWDLAEVYIMRGFAYDKLGQHQRALEDLNEAIRLKPDNAEAFNNRGFTYTVLGLYQRAIEDLDQAIRLERDYANAFNNRGFAYDKLGQHQRAIEDFNEAIRLKPDDFKAYAYRGGAYLMLGNVGEACRSFLRACELGSCVAYELGKKAGYCQ